MNVARRAGLGLADDTVEVLGLAVVPDSDVMIERRLGDAWLLVEVVGMRRRLLLVGRCGYHADVDCTQCNAQTLKSNISGLASPATRLRESVKLELDAGCGVAACEGLPYARYQSVQVIDHRSYSCYSFSCITCGVIACLTSDRIGPEGTRPRRRRTAPAIATTTKFARRSHFKTLFQGHSVHPRERRRRPRERRRARERRTAVAMATSARPESLYDSNERSVLEYCEKNGIAHTDARLREIDDGQVRLE